MYGPGPIDPERKAFNPADIELEDLSVRQPFFEALSGENDKTANASNPAPVDSKDIDAKRARTQSRDDTMKDRNAAKGKSRK